MAKYRKKPVVIEAMQWMGKYQDLQEWTRGECNQWFIDDDKRLIIPTLEGLFKANLGDWIIRGIKGEFYPCKPDIFVATYEEVI